MLLKNCHIDVDIGNIGPPHNNVTNKMLHLLLVMNGRFPTCLVQYYSVLVRYVSTSRNDLTLLYMHVWYAVI